MQPSQRDDIFRMLPFLATVERLEELDLVCEKARGFNFDRFFTCPYGMVRTTWPSLTDAHILALINAYDMNVRKRQRRLFVFFCFFLSFCHGHCSSC